MFPTRITSSPYSPLALPFAGVSSPSAFSTLVSGGRGSVVNRRASASFSVGVPSPSASSTPVAGGSGSTSASVAGGRSDAYRGWKKPSARWKKSATGGKSSSNARTRLSFGSSGGQSAGASVSGQSSAG